MDMEDMTDMTAVTVMGHMTLGMATVVVVGVDMGVAVVIASRTSSSHS